MKKMHFSIICFLSIFITVSTVHAQKVLLDEDFNTNKNNWLSYTGDQVNYLIYNGKYIVAVNDSLTYNINMPVTLDDSKDFTVSFTSTHTDGATTYAYGLFFGSSDLSNYYYFYIASSGYYKLGKTSTGGITEIIKWTETPVVKKGNYVSNTLQLSKKGTNWIISANGQTLATVPAMPFMGNKLGFSQSTMQRVEYDDVKVIQN